MPKIDPNYLEHPDDIHDLKCAFDFIRKLSNQKEIKEITKEQIDIDILKSNDEELIDHFKKIYLLKMDIIQKIQRYLSLIM